MDLELPCSFTCAWGPPQIEALNWNTSVCLNLVTRNFAERSASVIGCVWSWSVSLLCLLPKRHSRYKSRIVWSVVVYLSMQYSCAPRFSTFDLRFTHWFNLRSIKVSAPRLQERRVDLQPAWPKRPRQWTCSTKEQANKEHSLQTAKTRELTAKKTVQDKKYIYI